jgi:hypothetical protein
VCSSKEDSLKDLQGLASQLFSKAKSTEEIQNAEADNRRKQHNKEPHPNSNLSPLARFLLSRFLKLPHDSLSLSLSLSLSYSHYNYMTWKMLVNNLRFIVSQMARPNFTGSKSILSQVRSYYIVIFVCCFC